MPQGSMSARTVGPKRAIIYHQSSARLKKWRTAIRKTLLAESAEVIDGAVSVELDFILSRPKSTKRALPCVKPDLDKLVRAVLDALEGPSVTNDSRVTSVRASKRYGDTEGVMIKMVLEE